MANFFDQFDDPIGGLLGFEDLAGRVEHQESRGRQNAVSPKGASGVMQIMPDTMRDPGFGVRPYDPNAADPEAENRRTGRDYLKAMLDRYGGDEEAALAAYNWGPGNADKWVAGGKTGRLPRETQGYIANIMGSEPKNIEDLLARPDTQVAQAEPMRLGGKSNFFDQFDAPSQEQAAAAESAESGIPEPVQAPPPPPQVAPQAPPERPYQPTPWGEIGDDAMSSTISAGGEMAQGLAGLPGDARGLMDKGISGIGNYLNLDPETISRVQQANPLFKGMPTSDQIRSVTPDFSYTPKTGAGEIIKQVMPYTVGAGGKAVGATRKAVNVLAPAVAGEAGGIIAGQPGEIIAATLAGGRLGGARTPKGYKDTNAIYTAADDAYEAAKGAGIDVLGKRFYAFTRSLERDKEIRNLLKDPKLAGNFKNDLGALFSEVGGPVRKQTFKGGLNAAGVASAPAPAWSPGNISVKRYDELRRGITQHLKSPNENERRMANKIVNKMDSFFNSDKNFTGSAKAIRENLAEGRKLTKMRYKSKDLDKIMQLVENRTAGLTHSGKENAIRLEFKKLADKIAKSDVEANRWSKDEKQLINKLARIGWGPRRLLRTIGRHASPGSMVGAGAGMYGMYTGDWGGMANIAAVGLGSRALGGKTAENRAKQLQKLTRAGGSKIEGNPQLPYWAALAGSGMLGGQ